MKVFQILLCAWLLTSFSCQKEEDIEPNLKPKPPEVSPKPTLVWKASLHPNKTPCSSLPPVLFEDKVIFGAVRYSTTENMQIMALSKEGAIGLWTWREWKHHAARPTERHAFCVSEPFLILSYPREIHKVDIRTGKTVWSDFRPDTTGGENRVNTFGDMFLTTHEDIGKDFSALVRCNISQFQGWDTIHSAFRGADNFTPNFCSPSAALAPWGDTLLVFQDRSVNFKSGQGRITMYGYNLTADSVLWKTLLPERNSNVALPLIEGDRVYFQTDIAVYCFNLLTGQVVWRQDFGGGHGFLTTNLLIVGEKLIAGPHDTDLFAVDKMTGKVIWRNVDSGGSRNYMVHYKGRIYFTAMGSAKLHCVDLATGINIFAERPPTAVDDDRASYFDAEIAIDEATGLLYTHDRFHALCLKLPE